MPAAYRRGGPASGRPNPRSARRRPTAQWWRDAYGRGRCAIGETQLTAKPRIRRRHRCGAYPYERDVFHFPPIL
ncbi:hypothetical protein FPJ27_34765 [Burkholderia sp. MS455]|nr:hypothetical protein FPJ27_34765 [Burkholderia sp. MS455]